MSDNNLGVKDEFYESMLTDFLDESGELLEQLNQNLLQLDEWASELSDGESARCDETLMNEMFRAAHSFKGLSAMLGLDEINGLTHKIENVFDAARNDQLAITSDVVELIFQSVDRLVGMVDCLRNPSAETVDCENVLSDIQALLQSAGAEREKASQEDADAAFEAAVQEALAAAGQRGPDDDSEPKCLEESSAGNTSDGDELVATVGSVDGVDVDHFGGILDDTDISSKYMAIFVDEAEASLDDLSEKLIASADEDVTESVLIICHRIKGSAASIGLNRAAKLAHFMEDLLQDLQQSKCDFAPELADAMLKCTDALRTYVECIKHGDLQPDSFNQVYLDLFGARATFMDATNHSPVPASNPAPDVGNNTSSDARRPQYRLDDGLVAELAAAAPGGTAAYVAEVIFRDGLPLVGLKARLAYEKVASIGQVFYCRPEEGTLDELEEVSCLILGVATEKGPAMIHNRLCLEGVEQIDLRLLSDGSSKPTSGTESQPRNKGATDKRGDQSEPINDTTPKSTTPKSNVIGQPKAAEAQTIAPKEQQENQTSQQPVQKIAASGTSSKPAETVRVDIDRLDQLMNLAGQLVINKARFAQIGDRLKHFTASKQVSHSLGNAVSNLDRLYAAVDADSGNSHHQVDLATISSHVRRVQADLQVVQREVNQFAEMRGSVNELTEAVHQLDRVADGIQKSVMDTRMVPIGPLFGRFKRVIRDITRDNGKDIRLDIRGEKTELDKRMIDELGDPLIHMIRNSADHGIESPEDRESAGKPRQGTVTLDAFHRGNSIVIQVGDDGKGLDPVKIRNKAIEKGIISAADAEKLTQQQMFQLIWEPGLSTAETVTQVSGRGMGMDIVRSKIEELSGAVELDSTVGVGTTITIKLPLTLAILPSLLADIHDDVFAMPVESVIEIVRVDRKDLGTVHGLTTACVRGRIVSVVRLSELFTWNQQPTPEKAKEKEGEDTTLVIVGSEGREIGLVVHGLLGEEDIVIKSLAENYQNVEGIAGASILGDGRVALILDVAAVLESASRAPIPAITA